MHQQPLSLLTDVNLIVSRHDMSKQGVVNHRKFGGKLHAVLSTIECLFSLLGLCVKMIVYAQLEIKLPVHWGQDSYSV